MNQEFYNWKLECPKCRQITCVRFEPDYKLVWWYGYDCTNSECDYRESNVDQEPIEEDEI